MSSAKDRDERLADWLDGRLSPRDHERFEAELRVNPDLRRRAEEYRRTVESLQRALRAPMPKVDVADAVMQRIAEGGARPTPVMAPSATVLRGASRRALLMSSTVAAAVFVLIALLFRWRPEPEKVPLAEVAPGAAAPRSTAGLPQEVDPGTVAVGRDAAGDDKVTELDTQWKAAEQRADFRQATADALNQPKADGTASPPPTGGVDREALQPAPSPAAPAAPPASDLQSVRLNAGEPPPLVPPSKDDKLLHDFADAVRRTEMRDFGAAAPVLPLTMLPQVRLLRRSDGAHAVPQGQTPEQVAAAGFFIRDDADLATALPSGSLQIQRLEHAPGRLGTPPLDPDRDAESEAQAWLVEGPGPEVYHYLSMLSGAGRSLGFELVNGEVASHEVLAALTATAVEGETKAAEEQNEAKKLRGADSGGGGRGAKAQPEGAAKEKAKAAAPVAGAPTADTPVATGSATPEPTTAVTAHSRAAPQANSGVGGGEVKSQSNTPGSSTPLPRPSDVDSPLGFDATMPTRMRVVIVIDRAPPQKR